MEKKFEQAIREKFRFHINGMKTVEEVYDLSDLDLEALYGGLTTRANALQATRLFEKKNRIAETIAVQIEIVEYIAAQRIAEKEARKAAGDVKAQKAEWMEILADKERQDKLTLTPEQIRAKLAELDA